MDNHSVVRIYSTHKLIVINYAMLKSLDWSQLKPGLQSWR